MARRVVCNPGEMLRAVVMIHFRAMRSTSSSGSSIDGDAPNPNPQSAAATNSEDLFRNENVENSRLLV